MLKQHCLRLNIIFLWFTFYLGQQVNIGITPYQISKDLFDVLSYIRLPNMLGNVPHFTCQDSFVESVYHFIETSGLPRKIEQNTCTQMAIDFSEEITFGSKSYNTSIFT